MLEYQRRFEQEGAGAAASYMTPGGESASELSQSPSHGEDRSSPRADGSGYHGAYDKRKPCFWLDRDTSQVHPPREADAERMIGSDGLRRKGRLTSSNLGPRDSLWQVMSPVGHNVIHVNKSREERKYDMWIREQRQILEQQLNQTPEGKERIRRLIDTYGPDYSRFLVEYYGTEDNQDPWNYWYSEPKRRR